MIELRRMEGIAVPLVVLSLADPVPRRGVRVGDAGGGDWPLDE
jgi:hypothetical protein